MKRILLFSALFGSSAFLAKAQMLTPTVVASAGDYYTTSWGSLSWTAGESAVETFVAGNNILTQGFQQPEQQNITVIGNAEKPYGISVYPNPTQNVINLHFTNATLNGPVMLELVDMTGKVIYSETVRVSAENGAKIDLGLYSGGLYILKITGLANGEVQLLKVQKNN
jgi:hypothetical protein